MGRITHDQVFEELIAQGAAIDADDLAVVLGTDKTTVVSLLRDGERDGHLTCQRGPDGVTRYAPSPSAGEVVVFADLERRMLDRLEQAEDLGEDGVPGWRLAVDLDEAEDRLHQAVQSALSRQWVTTEGDRVKIAERGKRKLQGDIENGRYAPTSL
jgi:hypothetical protein